MRQYRDDEKPPSLLLLQAILLTGSRVYTNAQLTDNTGGPYLPETDRLLPLWAVQSRSILGTPTSQKRISMKRNCHNVA